MPISIVGTASVASNTITIPAHQSGDLIVVFGHASGNSTYPAAPSAGGNVPTWLAIANTVTTYSNSRVVYAVGTGSTTSGTWTNTDMLMVAVLRGVAASPIGGKGTAVAASGSSTAPAVTLSVSDGSSALLHFHSWGDGVNNVGTIGSTPSGYTQQLGSALTTKLAAVLNTKNTTTSAGSVVQTFSGTVYSSAATVEVLASTATTTTLTPAGASIAVTGTAPRLDATRAPAAATVTVTSTAPSLVTTTVLTPAAASATVTGTAPTLDLIVSPPGGSLTGALITVTGSAPTLDMSLVTTGDTITITGGTPSTAGVASLTPAAATITVTGSNPKLSVDIVPSPTTLPVTGTAPTLVTVSVLSPTPAAIVITGAIPTVINPISLTPANATITVTGGTLTLTVGIYTPPAPTAKHTVTVRREERILLVSGSRIHTLRRASRYAEA